MDLKKQLPARKAGVPSQNPGGKKAHDRLLLFKRWQTYKLGETTGAGETHGRSAREKRETGRRYHLILLRQKKRMRVEGVPEVINKEKSKTGDMFGSGHFDPRTGKKWDNTHKTATPKVKREVLQALVEEDRKSNDKGEYTVLTSYAQLLKANGFINISVHGDAKIKESRNFEGDAVSEFGIRCLQIDDTSLPDTTRHDQGAIFF